MAQTRILTSENVMLEQTAASLFQRGMAWAIDFFIMSFLQSIFLFITFAIEDTTHNQTITWIAFFIFTLAVSLYPLLMEIFCHGQTVGKRICGIKVIRLDGSEPSLSDSMTRWVLLLVDFFVVCIGMLLIIFSKNSQRIGDMAAGTTVVKKAQHGYMDFNLEEFQFVSKLYRPEYPAAQQLTPGQAALITRTFAIENWDTRMQMELKLAEKVANSLKIDKGRLTNKAFLNKVLCNYLYYQSRENEDT